jgi:tetratricopeptide (TPR) repeat protein
MTLLDIGQIAELREDFEDSLALSDRALRLFRAAGDQGGQAQALNNLSVYSLELDRYEEAVDYCKHALEMAREQSSHSLEFATLDTLGQIQHRAGDTASAVATYNLAIEKGEAKGYRFNLPDVLDHLGDCLADAGQITAAQDTWARALSILEDFQRPDMFEAISAKLHRDQQRELS